MLSTLKFRFLAVCLILLCCMPFGADAHEPDHTYIFLRIYENSMEGRVELTPSNLNADLGLNLSIEVDSAEIAAVQSEICEHIAFQLGFHSGGSRLKSDFYKATAFPLDDEEDQIQVYFNFPGMETVPDELEVRFEPLFDDHPNHKGVLIIEHNWKAGIIDNHALPAATFQSGNTSETIDLTEASLWKGFWAMTKLGMWHIWIGLDHILFLVALILPSVVRRRRQSQLEPGAALWKPVEAFKPAFLYLLGIITSFTIAHSITLGVAAFGWVDLPGALVESIIAFSIALAAFHNIKPLFKGREWVITFAFGLFHGLGFASVLGEKGLGGEYMTLSLLGFNAGVEIGQVLIVAGIFPILYLIRKTRAYPHIIKWGSVLLIVIALHWVVERAFDIDIRLGSFLDSFL